MNEDTFSEQYRAYQAWKHGERTPQDYERHVWVKKALDQIYDWLEVMDSEDFMKAVKALFDDFGN